MKDINLLLQNNVDVYKALEIWGNDIDAYNENLKDYQKSLTDKIKELENYKNNGDYTNYGILAHSLKSESKYFGFMNEAEVFLQHELNGKQANGEFIQSNFPNLKELVNKILNLLNQYFMETKLQAKNILAVDDSVIILNYIEHNLPDGYNVLKAKNGNEALTLLANNDVYAIFLDLNMPDSNGFEVLNYLKDQMLIHKIPVVVITGDDTKDTIDKAFTYPILEFLNKPFNEENLNRVLSSVDNFYKEKQAN